MATITECLFFIAFSLQPRTKIFNTRKNRDIKGQDDLHEIMMKIILGIKEWIFVAPGEENKVEISPANYIYDIESIESLKLQV